jgi:hypothetical protein
MKYKIFPEVEKTLSDEYRVNALLQKITSQIESEQQRK